MSLEDENGFPTELEMRGPPRPRDPRERYEPRERLSDGDPAKHRWLWREADNG
jgi:hypothetical protein